MFPSCPRFYMTCLLRSSLEEASAPLSDHFHSQYVSSLRATRHYRAWRAGVPPGLAALSPGHPCSGQHLSMADMKLRLSHNLTNTEGGKKVTAAVQSTGRYGSPAAS